MSDVEQLEAFIDLLRRNHVPSLGAVELKACGAVFHVWRHLSRINDEGVLWYKSETLLVAGSFNTIMLWLGCVAVTKSLRPYMEFEPHIVAGVVRSADRAGVLDDAA